MSTSAQTIGYREGYSALASSHKATSLHKAASYVLNKDIALNSKNVPISESLQLIKGDPYLSITQKDIAATLFENAEQKRYGLTSGTSLMRSAITAGAGGGAGYLFGRAASSLFSLPSIVSKRLSVAGAIAGALTSTGIFTEFGK
jgi:hypothetical protein